MFSMYRSGPVQQSPKALPRSSSVPLNRADSKNASSSPIYEKAKGNAHENYNSSPKTASSASLSLGDSINRLLSKSGNHSAQNNFSHNSAPSKQTPSETPKRKQSDTPSPSSSDKKAKSTPEVDDNIFQPPRQYLSPPELVHQLMKWRPECKVGTGLDNVGNTCFLNSVIQCLTHTPPLAHLAMARAHSRSCNSSGFCMFCILENHIQKAFSAPRPIVPKHIAQNLKVIGKQFRLGRQEDSHEFMRYVIEALQKSCLLPFKDRKLAPRVSETTIVHNIFGGYLQSQVKCSVCGYESNTFDPFLDLSLEVRKSETLLDCFRQYTLPESLHGQNKYNCCKCRKLVNASKQLTIHKTPNILTIQFKRFEYSYFSGGKINHFIEYPEKLNITPFLSKSTRSQNATYSLYGVLVHLGGSTSSGHYYCFAKSAEGKWHKFDDSHVSASNISTALGQRAYILFYQKDNPGSNPVTPSNSALNTPQSSTQKLQLPKTPERQPESTHGPQEKPSQNPSVRNVNNLETEKSSNRIITNTSTTTTGTGIASHASPQAAKPRSIPGSGSESTASVPLTPSKATSPGRPSGQSDDAPIALNQVKVRTGFVGTGLWVVRDRDSGSQEYVMSAESPVATRQRTLDLLNQYRTIRARIASRNRERERERERPQGESRSTLPSSSLE